MFDEHFLSFLDTDRADDSNGVHTPGKAVVSPKFYYENLSTSQVSWDLPVTCMSNAAVVACTQILTMREADTTAFIGCRYPGLSVIMQQLDTLDDYLVKTSSSSSSSSSSIGNPQSTSHSISKRCDSRPSSAQVDDELPEGWRKVLDKKKNKYFYVNT